MTAHATGFTLWARTPQRGGFRAQERVAARDQKLVEEAEVKPLAIARLAAHRAESEQLREAVAANCQGSVSAQRPNAHCAVRIVQLTW